MDTASRYTSAFFSLNSYFLTVFYYCYFLILFEYFGSSYKNHTKRSPLSLSIFLSDCLSSFFLLTSTLVHLSLSLHLSLIIYVLALVMREAGTQELKFSCKRSCLVKIVLYIKNDFLKKKMTLL